MLEAQTHYDELLRRHVTIGTESIPAAELLDASPLPDAHQQRQRERVLDQWLTSHEDQLFSIFEAIKRAHPNIESTSETEGALQIWNQEYARLAPPKTSGGILPVLEHPQALRQVANAVAASPELTEACQSLSAEAAKKALFSPGASPRSACHFVSDEQRILIDAPMVRDTKTALRWLHEIGHALQLRCALDSGEPTPWPTAEAIEIPSLVVSWVGYRWLDASPEFERAALSELAQTLQRLILENRWTARAFQSTDTQMRAHLDEHPFPGPGATSSMMNRPWLRWPFLFRHPEGRTPYIVGGVLGLLTWYRFRFDADAVLQEIGRSFASAGRAGVDELSKALHVEWPADASMFRKAMSALSAVLKPRRHDPTVAQGTLSL